VRRSCFGIADFDALHSRKHDAEVQPYAFGPPGEPERLLTDAVCGALSYLAISHPFRRSFTQCSSICRAVARSLSEALAIARL
jgi:hypothetical protein